MNKQETMREKRKMNWMQNEKQRMSYNSYGMKM